MVDVEVPAPRGPAYGRQKQTPVPSEGPPSTQAAAVALVLVVLLEVVALDLLRAEPPRPLRRAGRRRLRGAPGGSTDRVADLAETVRVRVGNGYFVLSCVKTQHWKGVDTSLCQNWKLRPTAVASPACTGYLTDRFSKLGYHMVHAVREKWN